MLTLRGVGEDGFGKKVRDWNRTERLQEWRERWAEHVNGRLADLDIDPRIDHRSFADRGIGLEPQHKIGPAASRMAEDGVAKWAWPRVRKRSIRRLSASLAASLPSGSTLSLKSVRLLVQQQQRVAV